MSMPHAPWAQESEALELTFLVAHCPACARDVLTVRDLDAGGALLDVCMHCQAPLGADAPGARWLLARDLLDLGYFVDGVEPERHGHEGGCRGGSCGIRQPAPPEHVRALERGIA